VTGEPAKVRWETLKAVFNAIIVERGGAVGSAHIAKQALNLAYRLRGHPPPDWGRLREFFQGVKRMKGGPRRRAQPLRVADLEAILGRLDPTNARQARDGCLLTLGWAAALRSDELVTLGWDAPGRQGKGYLTTSDRGIEIHLDRAKTAQDGDGQRVIIPAADAPLAMTWLAHWVQMAGRQPGRLVFLQMSRSSRVIPRPMSPTAVTAVVRTLVHEYLLARGMEPVAAWTTASHYRSHSLRAGYATEAADRGVVLTRIQEHCRHKSPLTTAGYIRLAQDWGNSGLKGLLP
jgi:integrase